MKIVIKRFFRRLWKIIIVTFWRYIVNPISYSISGMRFMRHERAYRVELVCGILAWPVCCYFFGFTWKLMVVTIEFMILLLTECLNTAIEAVVDYVAKNKKFHLAKKSKDIASAAVSIALFNICTTIIFLIFFQITGK